MIYFDNAATSRRKPDEVLDAYMYYVKNIGTSPGRGSYKLGIEASRMLYQARKIVAEYFGMQNAANVIFTKNSTEAINLFLKGYLKDGDHVLLSPFEHNAVLRPIHDLKEKGRITYTVLPEQCFYEQKEETAKYLQPNTRLAVSTLASNLTGQIVFSKDWALYLKEHHAPVFVDASQGGGKGLIQMEADGVDYLAFTGHKDLMGLPGVGGLCSVKELQITPLIQGGTGIRGDLYTNPAIYPEAYESGTLNMPAIWALKRAIEYVMERQEEIRKKELELTAYLLERLSECPRIEIYEKERERVPVLCFNIKGIASSTVVERLGRKEICVRGGIHCAILAHNTLGTVEKGAVRVSLNLYNTIEEIDQLMTALEEMISECI